MSYSRTPYDQLLEEAESVTSRIEELGLMPRGQNNRFQQYVTQVTGINLAIQEDRLDQYLALNNLRGEGLFAMKQLSEMLFVFHWLLPIWDCMSDEEKKNLRERFSAILSGPIYPSEETEKNSAPRNFQYELLLASEIVRRGYSGVRFQKHPDVLVKSNGRFYPIECKRFTGNSETALLKATKEAVGQLDAHPIHGSIGGIVAIDLSRKYEWPSNILEGKSLERIEEHAHSLLKRDLEFIYRRSLPVREASKQRKLVAMIANLTAVYVVPDSKQIGWLHEMAILVFREENPAGTTIFAHDLKKLRDA